jgi:hypothetical protein
MKKMCSITSMIKIQNKYSCAKFTTFITTMPFVNLTGFLEYIYIYIYISLCISFHVNFAVHKSIITMNY